MLGTKRDFALSLPAHRTSQKTRYNLDSQRNSKPGHSAGKHSEYFSCMLGKATGKARCLKTLSL